MVADNILGIARDLLTVRVQTINSEAAVLGAQKSKYEAQADALRAYEALVQQVDQARANEAERRRREQTSPAPPPQPPPAPQETVPKRSDGEGSGAVPEYED
jgi:hypothetical protein